MRFKRGLQPWGHHDGLKRLTRGPGLGATQPFPPHTKRWKEGTAPMRLGLTGYHDAPKRLKRGPQPGKFGSRPRAAPRPALAQTVFGARLHVCPHWASVLVKY